MNDTPALIERLAGYAPQLANGAATTLGVSLLAIALGFLLGAALLGISLRPGLLGLRQRAVALYVSFFRGTPLLVQLLMLFYLPSSMGIDLPPPLAALLALGLNSAAFQCEILRAGLAAIPHGQIEAARPSARSSCPRSPWPSGRRWCPKPSTCSRARPSFR